MLTDGNSWTPESSGRILIRSAADIETLVEQYGFLPYFKCRIPGFSVEEYCSPDGWWSGDPRRDPWEWRSIVAQNGRVAYAKLFENKAGFVSREWYPVLASYRRDGYDFDARCDEGLVYYKDKVLYETVAEQGVLLSKELKELCQRRGNGLHPTARRYPSCEPR